MLSLCYRALNSDVGNAEGPELAVASLWREDLYRV